MKVKNNKKGFTLPELVVTLIVLAIILAIGIPTAINYIRRAEFRKNEENAKTIYMASESVLTWYRSSGQWEEFREEVLDKGIKNTAFTGEMKDRIYAVTLAPGAYGTAEGDKSPVLDLMDNLTYSKDMLSQGAVAIEIDVESGHVYSAFYGTHCNGLDYGTGDAGGILDMDDRSYESRRDRFLGYYSADDITNVVDLSPVRLKISSISLVNSETLYLNWSSNSRHDNMDLEFNITFYEKNSKKELFQLTVDMAKAIEKGWSGSVSDVGSITQLPLIVDGQEIAGWSFPLIYQDGAFSLVLDGMMSADALAALQQTGLSTAEKTALHQSSDMSITRLARISKIKEKSGVDLSNPQNIYATVKAVSTYKNTNGDMSEYRQSSAVSSNSANTMYADGTKESNNTLEAGISTFRHLSNIRYFDASKSAEFTLKSNEMDWNSAGTGLYGYAADGNINKLKWTENDGKLEFPAIQQLSVNYSLDGGSSNRKINNLRLGKTSAADDKTTAQYKIDKTEYVGLFCEAAGDISNITFHNPSMVMADVSGSTLTDVSGFGNIKGVGIVAGKGTGNLKNIAITTDSSDRQVLTVSLPNRNDSEKTAGVGGIAGVLVCSNGNAEISNLSVSGKITAKLPDPGTASAGQTEAVAENYKYGVGGLFGYADLTSGAKIRQCENHAAVSANLFGGGIAGHVYGSFVASNYNSQSPDNMSNLIDCKNDGLILCSAGHGDNENRIEGRYFGGIIGYANKVLIYEASSASGRASGFVYSEEADKGLLKGQYVGGILGFGSDCLLLECSTESKGYILGSDYVGGIVGGLTQHANSFSRIGGGISVTTNAGYVIGYNYVGGIIGKNDGSNKVENCVNNGVAAGYTSYIGGIVGYNGEGATVSDCVSYISDHSGEIFNRIVNTWKAAGSYAGGIAGYNNGTVEFKGTNSQITVKSVSGIVVGQDYVGGVVGFNDTKGNLDVDYTLIGGRIYAYGDCAGGYIGLNASTSILTDEIEIKPSSVDGRYCVGGCIGANVVDLKKNITMDGFRTNNRLGSLTAKAFAGGVIGYQRTYTAGQFGNSYGGSMLSYMQQHKYEILPQPDNENLPTKVTPSDNLYQLTLTDKNNNQNSLSSAINTLPVSARMYVGGVLGYCENGSKLTIKNCKNEGRISKVSDANGVGVARYLEDNGFDASEVDSDIKTDMAGGIIGVNLTNQVIDHCANSGSLTGFTCLGGVAGFNGGGVFNCELAGNFGNASQDYVGGIAGLNIKTSSTPLNYKDVKGKEWNSYVPGTIAVCRVNNGVTVTGRNTVGGIAAYNLSGGVIQDSICIGNITARGNYAGGIAGRNNGLVFVGEDNYTEKRTISGRNGQSIGGLVGCNEVSGSIQMSGNGDVIAVNSGVTVIGGMNVGGLIGENKGSFGTADGILVCRAAEVHALQGNAGGIAGISSKDISYAKNASGQVTADNGLAGGIAASNPAGGNIQYCVNEGNVNSNHGYAGGIAAENWGTIQGCSVGTANRKITVRSRGVAEVGAVCAVNHAGASIESCSTALGSKVTLDGDGKVYGGVTGLNEGSVKTITLTVMPDINANGVTGLSVGGAAGVNQNYIADITGKENFENFSNYRYLGGIAGENRAGAEIINSSYAGEMTESSGASAGNCYGGIAGINAGEVSSCRTENLTMNIQGAYAATPTSTAEEKEAMASHTGGIVGKNEADAIVSNCSMNSTGGSITVANGMAGGVAGYNKGTIIRCGDEATVNKMSGYTGSESVDTLCESMNITAHDGYVNWGDKKNIEDLTYNNNDSVSGKRTRLILSTKGSLGGITAYNGPTGKLEYCAAGDWFLNNKSGDISVGTGGVIGMNESEQDMKYLVNRAFVGRQIQKADTNRFAGGIIGNQSNSTMEGWTLSHCVNYGMVYGYNSHYCGGIIGQWTGSGGNIEECRNYGGLQTTYTAGWVGASAGIVAQLYHAYDGNTYNIIGCGNFGSIYGQGGQSYTDSNKKDAAANDSAGILGNVTTYRRAADQAQRFTIQVLDCVNGPGVEIYSASMASGIVGFFSMDDPDNGQNIGNATGNVQLRIERCRNFSSRLVGKTYAAGIFGDRYGTTGARNTTIKDCYSVNDKQRKNFPIISVKSNAGSDGASVKGLNNYFFDDLDGVSSYQTSFSLAEGKENAEQSSGTISRWAYTSGSTDLWRAGSDRVYIMRNQTSGRYFAAYLTEAGKTGKDIDGKGCYIDPKDGGIYNSNTNEKIAKILFELPADAAKYTDTNSLVTSGSPFYTYVRGGWRTLEGAVDNGNGGKKLTAPEKVRAEIINGKIQLEITPDTNPDRWAEAGSKCDPFKYEAAIYVGGSLVGTEYLYAETGSVPIPASSGGAVSVEVRAVSMYEDVAPSDYTTAGNIDEKTLLPTPDIRAEIVWNQALTDYRYEISLNNLEDYNTLAGANWRVTAEVTGGQVELSQDKPTVQVTGDANQQQIIAQAVPHGTTEYIESARVSVAAFMPANYKPDASLRGGVSAIPEMEIKGTTLKDLNVMVSLTHSSDALTTPPIYRVDLLGTWKKGMTEEKENVVFASQDILVASKGTASVSFANLPEYMKYVSNLQVRIWFAGTGLGPVYSYHKLDKETGANVIQMTGLDESGKPVYEYSYTEILEKRQKGQDSDYYERYRYLSNVIFTWLPAPELCGVTDGDGGELAPEYDGDGNLQYTFYWDADTAFGEDAKYEIALMGIDEKGSSVLIDTSACQPVKGTYKDKNAWALTVPAEDWNFKKVKLAVTRVGDAAKQEIGLFSEASYKVRQRLPGPEQPVIHIISVDELDYTVTWPAITPETGCGSYQLYAQIYDKTAGSYGTSFKLKDAVAATGKAEYTERVNLEDYAGEQMRFYLVAQAAADSTDYVDSAAGITADLTVPERIAAPKVDWTTSWTYDRNQPLTVYNFESGNTQNGLTAKLKARDNASIPPGGSAYLMRAYIYETEDGAKAAIQAAAGGSSELTGYITGYLVEKDVISPVEMEKAESDMDYRHTMQGLAAAYAGKWVVFQARISSGSGNVSSHWVTAETPERLPYVKLDTAQIQSERIWNSLTAKVSENPDIPPSEVPWSAEQTTFYWNSQDYADVCYVDITEKTTDGTGILHQYRIHETLSGDGSPMVTVSEWGDDGNGNIQWNGVAGQSIQAGQYIYPLTGYAQQTTNPDGTQKMAGGYQKTVDGYYTFNDVTAHYELTTYAYIQADLQADGSFRYTLVLPDTASVKASAKEDVAGYILPGSEWKYSSKVAFRTDVLANEAEDTNKSPAYVGSDENAVELN